MPRYKACEESDAMIHMFLEAESMRCEPVEGEMLYFCNSQVKKNIYGEKYIKVLLDLGRDGPAVLQVRVGHPRETYWSMGVQDKMTFYCHIDGWSLARACGVPRGRMTWHRAGNRQSGTANMLVWTLSNKPNPVGFSALRQTCATLYGRAMMLAKRQQKIAVLKRAVGHYDYILSERDAAALKPRRKAVQEAFKRMHSLTMWEKDFDEMPDNDLNGWISIAGMTEQKFLEEHHDQVD